MSLNSYTKLFQTLVKSSFFGLNAFANKKMRNGKLSSEQTSDLSKKIHFFFLQSLTNKK
jgi:hypothetical protein